MKIYIATDHAGFELKGRLMPLLRELGHEVVDCGAETYDESDDYPDFIAKAAEAVSENPECRGVILGGSGQGEAIVANRYPRVRTAVYYGGPIDIVSLAREHNDANILSLGARFLSDEEAQEAVRVFLATPFSDDERHVRRIAKIDKS
ncbi:MAG: RpiB/LacA/LacB family sugar-phosphate isomerase [Candidatus Pacebacteria bacterium]|nr:RpiB/LacA/LacB family sugar-phosphate isomerase [Candidatus Paceibacterota bacterium]